MENDKEIPEEKHDLFYFDHVMIPDTLQVRDAVLSIFEATLYQVKQHHPRVKDTTVQSDNDGYYQGSPILDGLSLVS